MNFVISYIAKEKYIQDIKRDLMFCIVANIKNAKLTKEEAQEEARAFLSIIPSKNSEELLAKLRHLGEIFQEARAVFVKYGKLYDKQKREYILSLAHVYLQNRDINSAIAVLRGGMYE